MPSRRPPAQAADAIRELGRAWAHAERAGQTDALRELLTEDFEAVGPLGYVLDAEAWIDRHADGAIDYERFDWEHAEPRVHGDAAIVVGLQAAAARHEGEVIAGTYRATLVALRSEGRWQVAALHLTEMPATG